MPEPCRYKRTLLALALALAAPFPALLSAPGEAFAQAGAAGGEVTGVVLEIEQDDIILDIGSDRGAAEGDTVEIWRPLKLKHPVTGKLFTDRFLIGTLKLGQVRPALSLSKAEGSLTRDPVKGDIVIMASKAPRPRAPEAQPDRPTPVGEPPGADPGASQDPEAAAIGKMLDKLRGADPVQRIRVYEDYVRTQPKGRFARFLYEEAQALRKVYELERKRQSEGGAKEPKTPRELGEEPTLRSFEKPATAVGGQPLRLAVELSEKATGAVLHVRGAGQPGYVSLPMASSGNGYFAGTVPKESMTGSLLEFFIEASMPNGAVVPVVGQSAQPELIDLERPALPSLKTEAVGSVVLSTDFADYNRLLGNDYALQTEGYFQMRYGDIGVRALRTGFGVYRGKGGTVRELDEEGLAPREVGLTYGYLELEAAPTKMFSIIGRLVVGLENDGVAGGGQLMVRIGNDQQTNLQIGGELLGSVGARGITQLELNTFRRYPIVLRIEVTNQPAGGDVSLDQRDEEGLAKGSAEVGGRGIAQVGWRIVDPLVVSVRGSFQGRNINHAGPGFGGAVSYTW